MQGRDAMSSPSSSEQRVFCGDDVGADDEHVAARSVTRLLITASTSQQVEIVSRRIHTASVRVDRPFVQARARGLPPAAGTLRGACSDVLDAAGSVLLSDVEATRGFMQELLMGLLEELERERDPSAASVSSEARRFHSFSASWRRHSPRRCFIG
jgi:hypothetical protein